MPESRFVKTCLFILTGIAVAVALALTRSVMIPFVLALFLQQILTPLSDLIHDRFKVPRSIGATIALVLGILLVVVIVLLLLSTFRTILASSDMYRDRLIAVANQAISQAQAWGLDVDRHSIVASLRNLPFFAIVTEAAGRLVNFVTSAVLVLVFLIFLMSGHARKADEPVLPVRSSFAREVDQRIRHYLLTKVTSSVVTGVLVTGILLAFGLELALLFGFLALLLNFIPTLGSLVATLLPLPVALLQFEKFSAVVLVIALPGIIQFVIGSLIEPRFLGRGLDLHPVTVLLSLMIWSLIWGIPGAFLAVPIMAVIKIVLERADSTRGLSELMAGRLR